MEGSQYCWQAITSHRIAVVGSGLIGSALAGHLVLAGNEVTIGARRPEAFTRLTSNAKTSTITSARSMRPSMARSRRPILAIPNVAVAGFAAVDSAIGWRVQSSLTLPTHSCGTTTTG